MPPEQRLADYLCGTLTDEERAAHVLQQITGAAENTH